MLACSAPSGIAPQLAGILDDADQQFERRRSRLVLATHDADRPQHQRRIDIDALDDPGGNLPLDAETGDHRDMIADHDDRLYDSRIAAFDPRARHRQTILLEIKL